MTRANLIRELLRREGWTHPSLARRVGVSPMTVSRWLMEGPNAREPGGSAWLLILAMWHDADFDPASMTDPTAR